MSAFETSPNFEQEPNNTVFADLIDQATYVLDDAFNDSIPNKFARSARSIIELVQIDTSSLEGERLFSVLLTESGGKANYGVEMIRVLARPNGSFNSVGEAVDFFGRDYSSLPFMTGEYFVAHCNREGEWRYSRIDDQGVHPWLPNLKDLSGEANSTLEGVDIMKAILQGADPIRQQEEYERRRVLRLLDEAYAYELIDKLDNWPIVPQN